MKTLNRLMVGLGLAALTLTNALAQPTALEVQTELDMTLFQRKVHFEEKVTKTLTLDYLLYLPKDYTTEKTKTYPTILFLHGAGERGTNVNKVAVHGPPKLVKAGKDFPFIIISPQCPNGQVWSVETLNALLDDVEKTFRVDKTRLYLTGLSMGGYGTWSLGLGFPERFAAMAPICGGGESITYLLGKGDKVRGPLLKSMPIWAFHGAKDPVVPLAESERMVEMLKKGGNQNVKLTVYPEAQHDSWTATYDNPELFEWFLKFKRER
ncbi:MAG: phospholipase/carboxylesterase [Verrucomicrobia bacterium]|jgi:predicted peptidase|nr:phospholipase/carboxylesterase [Verrucomicrobiota bacterium]